MTFYKTKEAAAASPHSYITVYVHSKCLILNQLGGQLPNELFEFENYKKLLDVTNHVLGSHEQKRLKEWLAANCPEVKQLMDTIDDKGQFSLF